MHHKRLFSGHRHSRFVTTRIYTVNSKARRKHAREKRRRARIHLEHQQAQTEMNKPKRNGQGKDANQSEVDLSIPIGTTLGNPPEPTSTPKGNNSKKNAKKEEKSKLLAPFRFFDKHHGAITAFATLVLGMLTFRYVSYSKGQWERMTEANQLAQKTFEVSQQASVTLGRKDGVLAEFKKSPFPNIKDGLVIYFQNSGHMPATIQWGINEWFLENPVRPLPDPHRFEPMKRTRNKKTGAISFVGGTDGSIGGDAVKGIAAGYLPPGTVDYLVKTNTPLKLNGTYEYCDELGRYACRDFSLEYQDVPFGAFRIVWDEACVDRSFLGNTKPGPDEELLPMCVPRNAPAFPNH